MSISQQRRDLFHHSNALDKLALIQTLLDSGDLNSDQAFALLNTVHSELRQPGGHESRVYIRYGEVMGALHRQMPQVYREVIAKWEALRLGIQRQVSDEYYQDPIDEKSKNREKEYKVSYSIGTLRSVEKASKNTDDEETVEIGGGTEEVDQMATEAAEAAKNMEEQEAETTPISEEELGTEEEPPMEAAE